MKGVVWVYWHIQEGEEGGKKDGERGGEEEWTEERAVAMVHNGFAPSDCPIWTDFVGENIQWRALCFGKSYGENKNCSGTKNAPQKL